MGYGDLARRMVSIVGIGALTTGCSVSVEPGFGQECTTGIAADALRNPANPTIAANIVRQTGFAPEVNPDAPALQTKQVEFATPDGAMHYFAVPKPSWTRAALIRVVAAKGAPRIHFYVIGRDGNLLHATRIQSPQITPLNIQEDSVREGFRVERELWRSAGRDDVCGRG